MSDIRTALAELVEAVDYVGVNFLDTDTIHPLVDRLQSATLAARAALAEPPAAPGLSPSEAVYGFAGWLTCRDEPVTFGSAHDAALPAELVDAFCKSHGLEPTREQWADGLKPYPAQPAAPAEHAPCPFGCQTQEEHDKHFHASPAEPAALSDDQIREMFYSTVGQGDASVISFARAVERAVRGTT
jgi:hypothetical protein